MRDNKHFQWLFNITIMLLLIGLFVYFHNQTKKVGYLDFELLLRKYEGIQSGELAFDNNTKMFRDNIDTLTAEFNRTVEKFEAGQKKMSVQERNSQKQELEKQKADLMRYREAVGMKIREEQEKTISRYSKEIHDYVNEYSKKNNYTVVFFQKGDVIAYAEEGNDITPEVLAGLNEQYHNKKK